MQFDEENGLLPNPPPSRRRAVKRLLLYTLLHIAISFVLSFIVTLCFAAGKMASLSLTDYDMDAMMRVAEDLINEQLGPITYISLLCSSAVSILVYRLLFKRQEGMYPPLSAKRPASLRVLPLAIIATVSACLFAGIILTWLLERLPEGTQTSSLENLTAAPPIVFLSVVILGPVAEELCFRGLCLRNLNGAFVFRVANVFQALLFGMTHMVPLQVAYAFAFGLLLGWLYDRTGRILVPMISHMAFNLIGAIAIFFPEMAENTAEAAPDPAGDWIFCLFTLGVTVISLWAIASMTRQNVEDDGEEPPAFSA